MDFMVVNCIDGLTYLILLTFSNSFINFIFKGVLVFHVLKG